MLLSLTPGHRGTPRSQANGMFSHGSPMGGAIGVSLKQGLGLTVISRGRPGRRPGDERGSSPDYYFIIDKINPSSPGTRLVCPGS